MNSATNSVRAAYKMVSSKTGLRNVKVNDLLRALVDQVSQAESLAILAGECRAHRANPTRGEPTLLTLEEKLNALRLGGERYYWIELL